MEQTKIKVLYIAGLGRSGSTLLDTILGQIHGLFSVGEVHRLWDSGPVYNRVCGCGSRLVDCEIWSPILAAAFDGADGIESRQMVRLQRQGYRTRHLARMLLPGGDRWIRHRLGRHLDHVGRFYHAIGATTNSQVIVDSSKFPSYGFVLDNVDQIDLRILHLVRDPRAVVYSWQTHKTDPSTGKPLGSIHPVKTAGLWLIWNAAIQHWWQKSPRYMRVRYEDFVQQPRRHIEEILAFVDVSAPTTPFLSDTEVTMQASHTVAGNPIRLNQGTVTIRMDTRWQINMRANNQRVTAMLAWPLMAKYGYSLQMPTGPEG